MITGNELMTAVAVPGFMYGDGSYEEPSVKGGLTIRQHFAAMAMQGILSNPELMKDILKTTKGGLKDVLRVVALDSIDAADELISQLNETQPA